MKTNSFIRPALFLAAASASLFATRATAGDDSAPPPPPPPHHGHHGHPGDMIDPEKRLMRMTKHLDLTPEQQEQLRPLLVEQAEAVKKQAATREKIEAVLTPEQREKFGALRAGPRGKHHQGEDVPPAGE